MPATVPRRTHVSRRGSSVVEPRALSAPSAPQRMVSLAAPAMASLAAPAMVSLAAPGSAHASSDERGSMVSLAPPAMVSLAAPGMVSFAALTMDT
jgi:hypothetical protein